MSFPGRQLPKTLKKCVELPIFLLKRFPLVCILFDREFRVANNGEE